MAFSALLDLGHGVDVSRAVGGVDLQIAKDQLIIFARYQYRSAVRAALCCIIFRLNILPLPSNRASGVAAERRVYFGSSIPSCVSPCQLEPDRREVSIISQPSGQLQNLLHVDVAFFAVVGVGGHEGAVIDFDLKRSRICAVFCCSNLLPHHVGVQTSLSVVSGERCRFCVTIQRLTCNGNCAVSLNRHHVLAQVLDLEDVGAVDLCAGPLVHG